MLARKYGITQTRLTASSGITQSGISAVQNGHRTIASLDVIERLASAFNMPNHARVKLGLAPRGYTESSNIHEPQKDTARHACDICGNPLSRYNSDSTCQACVRSGRKERATPQALASAGARVRVGEPPRFDQSFWEGATISQAARSRDLQTFVRAYLDATGLTQETFALLIESDRATVSKIVSGRRKRFAIEDLEALRDGLHAPGHLFGLTPGPHETGASRSTDAVAGQNDGDASSAILGSDKALCRIQCGDIGEGIRNAQSIYSALRIDQRTVLIDSLAKQVLNAVPVDAQGLPDVTSYRELLSTSPRKAIEA